MKGTCCFCFYKRHTGREMAGLRLVLLKCEACGATQLKEIKKGHFLCEYCGSKFITDDNNEVIDRELTEKELVDILIEADQYEKNNEYPKALQCYLKAIEKAPDNIGILLKLGRAYRRNGLHDRALSCYDKALELEPSNAMVYCNIGAVYCFNGQYSKAEEYLKKAINMLEAGPILCIDDIATCYSNCAVAVGKLGRKKEAKALLKKAEANGYANGAVVRKLIGIKKGWFL